MAVTIPNTTLDEVLTIQLTVAWAGEGTCKPARLGWWRTDLIDLAGGGDLLQRLLPKTHRWASLQAVREAALRVDAKARAAMADPDKLRTLFFLGFELDERLGERLADHKLSGVAPEEALQLPAELRAEFSSGAVAEAFRAWAPSVTHKVVPGGRQVVGGAPEAPALMVQHLASALVPFADTYPMPFYRIK